MEQILPLTLLLTSWTVSNGQACYPQGGCNDGFMDKTEGSGPTNWACGEDCVGGELMTDWVCNCACIPLETCSWDPESIFDYYNDASNTRTKRSTSADSYIYATPGTAALFESGQIAPADVNSAVNDYKTQSMLPIESVLKECWRRHRETLSTTAECDRIILINRGRCVNRYPYKDINRALLNLRMYQCVTQNNHIIETMSGIKPAIHIEFGVSFSSFVYFQGATGVAFSTDGTRGMTTATGCGGVKLDISYGASVAVSYFWDFDEIAGSAITVEVGVDVPGTEAGIDALFHFSTTSKKWIGWRLSFGIGVGVMPIDFALSYCKTVVSNQFDSLSKTLAIGSVSGWSCNENLVGVISEKAYICCPGANTAHGCNGPFCWFSGTECAKSASCTGGDLQYRYAYFPGMEWIEEGYNNKETCLDLWRADWTKDFVRYSEGACWHGNHDAKCESFWAPVYDDTKEYDVYERFNRPCACGV